MGKKKRAMLAERPEFVRPCKADVLGKTRNIRTTRPRQRSQQQQQLPLQRPLLLRDEKSAVTEKLLREADERFRLERLRAATRRRASTDERVIALKRAIVQFLRMHGGRSERGLRRAFAAADLDNSGDLDYGEFEDAARNFGLNHLSIGALRTLFDAFDSDNSGSISHVEFAASLRATPLRDAAVSSRRGPLERPAIVEPRRVGFEAFPATLDLGDLLVSVIYEACVSVLNTGDTNLRLGVKLEGSDGARDDENPVRVVERPSGPLPPGLEAKIYLEIFVRAPGNLKMDLVVTSGGSAQEVVVPLSATLARRASNAIPSARRLFLLSTNSDDDKDDDERVDGSRRKLPKFLRRVTRPGTRRVPKMMIGGAAGRDDAVWPSLSEQWEQLQRQTAEAVRLLAGLPSIKAADARPLPPEDDLYALAVRLKRVAFASGKTLSPPPKDLRRILFVASGSASVAYAVARASTTSQISESSRQRASLLLGVDIDDDPEEQEEEEEEEEVTELRAPFCVGESSVLLRPNESPERRSRTVVATTTCQGFSLSGEEADQLVEKQNLVLAILRRDLLMRRFERECEKDGGLVRNNYRDQSFVDALLDYARTETRHEAKASFLCRQLLLTDQCRAEVDLLDDILSGVDKTDEQIRTERALAFDRCLVVSDQIWADFVGDDRSAKARRTNPTVLPPSLLAETTFQQMLAARRRARSDANFDLLYKLFSPLEKHVAALLDRALLPGFSKSRQYRAWLADRFPLRRALAPYHHPAAAPRDDARRPSLAYDLPALRPKTSPDLTVNAHHDQDRRAPPPFSRRDPTHHHEEPHALSARGTPTSAKPQSAPAFRPRTATT
ncbi:hypothetical protein CTAYLR_001763 [Chrysophaeum taylorii]|uniref:EF-hand domain-containing protein n=1 Tax=Chrysophaeum taylorii TaxID=2483200 RepID=A0AAD7UGL5_9STRA|nr:hypothetical protein CTAYLR_001763 [Chrysophaeum taylorii]